MEEDLRQAVNLLVQSLSFEQDVAEELLSELVLAETDPKASVLFHENCLFVLEVELKGKNGLAWLVGKQTYNYTFMFLILELGGARIIAEVIKLA